MMRKTVRAERQDAFERRIAETNVPVEGHENLATTPGIKAACKALAARTGVIEQGFEAVVQTGDSAVMAAVRVAAARRIGQYERSADRAVRGLATRTGINDLNRVVRQTEGAVSAADTGLSGVAEGSIYMAPEHGDISGRVAKSPARLLRRESPTPGKPGQARARSRPGTPISTEGQPQ